MEAISLIGKYLLGSYEDSSDLETRLGAAVISNLAGMAIVQAGVGAAHGFAMTLGGLYDILHSLAWGVLLGHVVEYQ